MQQINNNFDHTSPAAAADGEAGDTIEQQNMSEQDA